MQNGTVDPGESNIGLWWFQAGPAARQATRPGSKPGQTAISNRYSRKQRAAAGSKTNQLICPLNSRPGRSLASANVCARFSYAPPSIGGRKNVCSIGARETRSLSRYRFAFSSETNGAATRASEILARVTGQRCLLHSLCLFCAPGVVATRRARKSSNCKLIFATWTTLEIEDNDGKKLLDVATTGVEYSPPGDRLLRREDLPFFDSTTFVRKEIDRTK